MIRMIAGTFGFKNPVTGKVEAKNAGSEPFEIPADAEGRTEAELVELGVAEYVEYTKTVAPVQLPEKEEEVKAETAEASRTPAKDKKKAKKAQDEVRPDEDSGEEPDLSVEMPT